jgi:DNA-binding transcriptional LysR family regulator
MMTNLRQLEAFVTVCGEGSVTSAAEKMSLTQSAVSVLVRQFEDAFGAQLFDRQRRSLRPTPLAREMVPYAERILHDIAAFEARIHERAERERGLIEIAVTPTIGTTVMPAVLEAFTRQYPEARVHFHDVSPADILVLVASGSAAFGIGTFGPQADLDRTALVRYSLVLVGRRGATPLRRQAIRWSDAATLPLVVVGPGNTIRDAIDESFAAIGHRFEPSWEVSQFASAIAMVQRGLGYTILPSYLRYDYPALDLGTIDLVQPRTTRELVVVTHKHTVLPPATLALIDMLRTSLQQARAEKPRPVRRRA